MNRGMHHAGISETTEAGSRKRVTKWVPAILALTIFLTTIAVFWPAVDHPFMVIDDGEYVTEHPFVPMGLTWTGVGIALTAKHSGNWHPLTTLSHMLDCQIFGVKPTGHHLVNIVIHALNGVLVFGVLRKMTGSLWRSFFVAAIFALHPLRVESVAWVSERKDVLSVLFSLLTILAYAGYAKGRTLAGGVSQPSPSCYWLTLVFFALALLSKPMAVTLPCVLMLLDYWPLERFRISDLGFRKSSVARMWPLIREKIPFALLSAVVSFITSQVQQGAMAELKVLTLPMRAANMFLSYCEYLKQTFWPLNLGVVYPYNPKPSSMAVAFAVTIVLGVLVVAWLWRERRPWLLGGWLWFLGTLVPAIGIVQVGIQAHADRYTYLPSIGLLTLVVWALADLIRPRATGNHHSLAPSMVERVSAGLGLVVVVALACMTRAQLAYWENTEKLMLHTQRVAGNSELVHGALGGYYFTGGRLEEAEKQYRLGLQMAGDTWDYGIGLANVYAARGKFAEAEKLYRRALASQPSPINHFQLADFLQSHDRFAEAQVHYLKGLALTPYDVNARNRLGNLYARQQNWPAAREQYERALRFNPKAPGIHQNLGNVCAMQGNQAEATVHFLKALELDPTRADTHNSLGYAFALQGKLDMAIAHYRAALTNQPGFADAHFNLGEALARRGLLDEARVEFEATLKQQTNYAKAHVGLAGVFAARKETAKAVEHLRDAIRLDASAPDPLNNLAWLLATHRDVGFRNGPEALRLATRAVELTKTNDWETLDTLAAAYAETGQFPDAVQTAKNAIALARSSTTPPPPSQIEMRLRLYEQSKPFHETGPP